MQCDHQICLLLPRRGQLRTRNLRSIYPIPEASRVRIFRVSFVRRKNASAESFVVSEEEEPTIMDEVFPASTGVLLALPRLCRPRYSVRQKTPVPVVSGSLRLSSVGPAARAKITSYRALLRSRQRLITGFSGSGSVIKRAQRSTRKSRPRENPSDTDFSVHNETTRTRSRPGCSQWIRSTAAHTKTRRSFPGCPHRHGAQ